jgi:alpha-N-arabinofuranosidase
MKPFTVKECLPVAAILGVLVVSLAPARAAVTAPTDLSGGARFAVDSGRVVVQVDKPGAAISPMFYGLMTEEINYSYEGGLYGELIQNRIFRNPQGGGWAPAVTGTKEPGLFRSEHYSMSVFSCKIPNGKYLAKLYFAETYNGIGGPGQRVFSFNAQGHEFKNFDIWVKAGGPNRAYIETVPVEVTNGEFRIVFTPQIENPAINAIEIIPQSGSTTTIRIRAGQYGPFTDSTGLVWQPETGFEGGDIVDHGPLVKAPGDSIPNAPHWFLVTSPGADGAAATDTSDPINTTALMTSLKLTISNVPDGGRVGVSNDGYWGIPVKPNWTYQCSFYAKASDGFSGPLTVCIESNDGETVHASATVPAITDTWKRYQVTLKSGQAMPTADTRFVISAGSKGTVNFNQVSLFLPAFKERTGAALGGRPTTGFRSDIMQLLDDMHPAFLRFPGGNYIEGSNFANHFNWKTMIGPWEERPGHQSPWGYRSSDGLGLLEFLEWCEELDMEPVVGVYAGLHLDGGRDIRTGDALKPFIQDALDEIEYITGDVTTEWGARRARDGHPAPFKLTYVEIGNEDFLNRGIATYQGPEGRYAMFYNAIKAKYPTIRVVATTNPGVPHDVIDNHHYMSPTTAIRNAHLYDNADRTGPKVFEGEWASQERGAQRGLTPSFQCALSDAAFLTGLERNADIVVMNCYAPLFTRMNPGGSQWSTDLIGYDTLTCFGSPSYYVQKMFFNAKGDQVIPVAEIVPQTIATPEPAPEPAQASAGRSGRGRREAPPSPNEPLFACASKEDASGDIILKVVNIFDVDQTLNVELVGAEVQRTATGQVMVGTPDDINSADAPFHTVPKDFIVTDASSNWKHTFPGNSITVVRFKAVK